MQRSLPLIAAIVLVPVAAVVTLPVVHYLQSDRETLTLDESARRNVAGSFIRLRDGVTHYELAGPATGTTATLSASSARTRPVGT